MEEHKNDASLDILGVKPIANCLEHASKETIDGGKNFLSKICMPAADEFGLLLQDKVKGWRASNVQQTLLKAEKKLSSQGSYINKKAHPLISWRIIESSSWAQHDELQEIWAGLLASTCTKDGEDVSNLIFINILSQLTEVQIRIINYAVENANIRMHDLDLITAEELSIDIEQLKSISSINDVSRLDRELDHLSSMDLIGGGVSGGGFLIDELNNTTIIVITPRALAIQLYVRCQGFIDNPKEYFKL